VAKVQYTKAQISEKQKVDETIAAKLAARKAAGVAGKQQKTYPVGINMLGAVHSGFKDLYDAMRQ
jgi:hypothetical protein